MLAVISEAGWLSIVGSVVGFASLVSSLLIAYMAYRLKRLEQLSQATHDNTNSMKDALVASTKEASYAEGREDQRNVEGK